jgi:signal transduction histidine kinase
LSVDADPQLLTSAVMNLLHNAFKNTPSGGRVILRARAEHQQPLLEIEDECGGIPQSKGDLFQVFGDRRGSGSIWPWSGSLDRSEGGKGARRRDSHSQYARQRLRIQHRSAAGG